jgi:hypothetical protein
VPAGNHHVTFRFVPFSLSNLSAALNAAGRRSIKPYLFAVNAMGESSYRLRTARDNIDPEPIKRLSFRDRVQRYADAIKEKASGEDPENW